MPAKLGQVVAEDAISRLGLRPPSGFVLAIDESQRLLVGVTHDEARGGFFDGPGGGKNFGRRRRHIFRLTGTAPQSSEHGQTIRELDEARTELAAEKARAEQLLNNVLPAPVADELKMKGKVQPRYTRSATILFADFQNFTLLAERLEPATLVGVLDQYFTAFDDIVARHGMEKLKTIGDAYMAVGGVPESNRRHPIDACLTALEMQATVARINLRAEKMRLPALELRIGIPKRGA